MKLYSLLSLIILLSLSKGALARDHVKAAEPGVISPLEYNAVDGTVVSQTQQYPVSIEGLRHYLDQEVTLKSRDYERLNTRLLALESQQRTASSLAWIPAGLGIGSMIVGSVMRQDDEPTDPRLRDMHEQGGRLLLYGFAGILGGLALNEILAPNDKDIRAFIRFHNGPKSQEPGISGGSSQDSLSLKVFSEGKLLTLNYAF